LWVRRSETGQKKRLKAFERDPRRRWRVTRQQWKHWRMFDTFVATADRAIRRTSTDHAPWHIIEGADERYRALAVGTVLRDAVRAGLARTQLHPSVQRRRASHSVRGSDAARTIDRIDREINVLDNLDLDQRLGDARFDAVVAEQQSRLNLLQRRARQQGISTIVVIEGWDAAGKGGAIRRVTGALDARDYQVIPIAAPTDEERAHHYLWRFWRHLSRAGRITIFDRSWYGRVLVERVEALATDSEWMRAYGEITQFEEQLVAHGILVVKFWLHISKGEQLRRFRERSRTAYKQWKITDEDWRNRARWNDYTVAVNDMVARTSTRIAPWTLVEANNKNFARVKVLRTLADRLARRLR